MFSKYVLLSGLLFCSLDRQPHVENYEELGLLKHLPGKRLQVKLNTSAYHIGQYFSLSKWYHMQQFT